MPRDTQRSFSAGVFGETLHSSADLERYRAAVADSRNMLGIVPRGMTRAPGTMFIAEAANHNQPKILIPFSFGEADSYAIELGVNYARFLRDGGLVLGGGGTPYQIATPWGAADLPKLYWQQFGNVLYIVNGGPKVWRLERAAHASWSIVECTLAEGPFRPPNTDETAAFLVTSVAGVGGYPVGASIGFTYSGTGLSSDDVGALFRIDDLDDFGNILAWAPDKAPTLNAVVRYADNIYRVTAVPSEAKFSSQPPLHEEGSWVDSPENGITLRFLHGRYGVMRIVSVAADGLSGMAIVERNLPLRIGTVPIWTWWRSAWTPARGGPSAVCEKGYRLYFGAGAQLDGTTVNGFGRTLTFEPGSEDDAAISVQLAARDPIRWIEDVGALMIGTAGQEISLASPARRAAITPNPLPTAMPESDFGGAPVKPVKTDGALLFVNRDGLEIVEMTVSDDGDTYNADDLTIINPDVLYPGCVRIDMAHYPDRFLVALKSDGGIVFMTYERRQRVLGWWPQARLNAQAIGCAVIPRSDGLCDDIYFIMRRTINGAVRDYLEVMRPRWRGRASDDPSMAHYLDSALRYQGAPATVISGLGHLEGQTVDVFADGAMQESKVVAAGQITLDAAAENVLIGLPIDAYAKLLPAQFQTDEGFTEGLKRLPTEVSVRYFETSLAEVRADGGDWQELFDTQGGIMSNYRPARSGVQQHIAVRADESAQGQVEFRSAGAFPMTIIAVETDYDLERR